MNLHIALAPAWDVVELLRLYPVDLLLHGNSNNSWVCRARSTSPDQTALAQLVQCMHHPFELLCKRKIFAYQATPCQNNRFHYTNWVKS